ncbi:MAG: RluA family pseudouridine synthase [Planctomycetes bacterium]|nr:RluA family pseudouridine synthase [Planctomycetota bacterium]
MSERPRLRSPNGYLVPATVLSFRVGKHIRDSPRVDLYVCARRPGLSRSYLQSVIAEGAVRVNEEVVRASKRVKAGDRIEVLIGRDRDEPLVAEDLPLSVLFEDDHVIAVDKPAGLACQPRHRHEGGRLVNRLVHHLSAKAGAYRAPFVVHRLDQDTTGVVVYAKTAEAVRNLYWQFRRREVEKWYLALVEGVPADGSFVVEAPIGRDPGCRERRMVRPDGKPARTRVEVRERHGTAALVALLLETGRTHQIRVHLAHAGFPVVGDGMYGGRERVLGPGGETLLDRQALHAERIQFVHPATGELTVLRAPVPDDFSRALAVLRAE